MPKSEIKKIKKIKSEDVKELSDEALDRAGNAQSCACMASASYGPAPSD